MADLFPHHPCYRHGPEYHWSDNQLIPSQDQFSCLDSKQQSLRTVLLWKLAGMVAGGTDGGAHLTFDVLRFSRDSDVGVD